MLGICLSSGSFGRLVVITVLKMNYFYSLHRSNIIMNKAIKQRALVINTYTCNLIIYLET